MLLDPITMEVVFSRLGEIAATMEHALFHSGYSPVLRESLDGTAGLADADGRVIIIGGFAQIHTFAYSRSIESLLESYPRESIREGDSFVMNDPYKAGNPHTPDFVAITPAFHGGKIVAFGVSVAHKPDIGGLVPGTVGAQSREIFHDGLLMPPVRFWSRDGINAEIDAVIRNNSRIPDIVSGDLRGQVGATRLGADRLAELCDEYGAATVAEAMAGMLSATGRRVGAELADWPDGEAEGEGFLDNDPAKDEGPIRIHVKATKKGDRLSLDFSGSGPQAIGPVNVHAPTAQAVSMLAVLATTDPTIPVNSGVLDCLEFIIPPGRIVSPQYPATMNHYFPAAHMTYNCVLMALGKLNPARAVAPSGLGNGAVIVGYPKDASGKPSVQYELLVTALGGTSQHDGASVMIAMTHFTPSTPVEILETEYPVRVRRFETLTDSAGAGAHRGGLGFRREYEILEDCVFTLRSSNYRQGLTGLHGGKGPPTSRAALITPDGEEIAMAPLETRQIAAGSVIRIEQSGGGGYGEPFDRPIDRVLADIENGYVSPECAAEDYGVVLDADGAIDKAATEARRAHQAANPE